MKTHMKSLLTLAFAAMLAPMFIPAQANTIPTDTVVATQTASGGDGADNRQCRMMQKQDKQRSGFCGP